MRDTPNDYDVIVIKPTVAPGRMAHVAAHMAGTKSITIKFRSPVAGRQVSAVRQSSSCQLQKRNVDCGSYIW